MDKQSLLIMLILLSAMLNACSKREGNKIISIPVDITAINPFPLSKIAVDIRPIKLELTEKSLISINKIGRILYDDNYILIQNRTPLSILLFDGAGRFIKQIGSKGEGPKEYTNITDIAADFKNKQIFVASQRKLICYNFNGDFIMESMLQTAGYPYCMSFIEDTLRFIGRDFGNTSKVGIISSVSSLYEVDKNLRVTDSAELKRTLNPTIMWAQHIHKEHITHVGNKTYQYEFELNNEPSLRDTLFQLDGMKRTPYIRLDFHTSGHDDNGERTLYLFNIYRSSRYIFAVYGLANLNTYFRFCYDTHDKEGYVMKDGYTDDIHHGNKIVDIHPIIGNTNKFYYLTTDMDKDSDIEEPNPTLYIGTLNQ